MKPRIINYILLILSTLYTVPVFSQADYVPTASNLEAREWFQDAKFGLFVHWGVYSVLGGGGDLGIAEWVMNQKQIPVDQYEKLPDFFNPISFDPVEWVAMVKDAGMKYITITSKHHDGFAMYNSEISDYNIVERTPYGKDIIGMLKEECDRQGIKLFFYYSQLDWHHTDYYPRGRTGNHTKRPESGEWDKYIDYMNTQLTELLTNYGDLGGIWFDGMWDQWGAAWRLEETYSLIHKLQPQALVGSNHHKMPIPGEDFQMFERDLPGQNTMGFNQTGVGALPLETCETMNGSWGFNLKDINFKSTKDLIHMLVRAAGLNSNLLLNTGPMPNGKIQPENVRTLQEMGKWMEQYGETIYGTRGGPAGSKKWGVSTWKDNKVYVHILDAEDPVLYVPMAGEKVKKAYGFDSGETIQFKKQQDGILLNLPEIPKDSYDFIIVLEF
ncbi:MAG: alpha-L-fucosidase [Bacteroidales bacterium]|nr:alpha-L-fucosidase [Bacteroidales bacterium]